MHKEGSHLCKVYYYQIFTIIEINQKVWLYKFLKLKVFTSHYIVENLYLSMTVVI